MEANYRYVRSHFKISPVCSSFIMELRAYVSAVRFKPFYGKLLYREIMCWEWRWIFEWEIIAVRFALPFF